MKSHQMLQYEDLQTMALNTKYTNIYPSRVFRKELKKLTSINYTHTIYFNCIEIKINLIFALY